MLKYPAGTSVAVGDAAEVQVPLDRRAALSMRAAGRGDQLMPGSAEIAADLNQAVANNARRFLFHHCTGGPAAAGPGRFRWRSAALGYSPGRARHTLRMPGPGPGIRRYQSRIRAASWPNRTIRAWPPLPRTVISAAASPRHRAGLPES